MFAGCIKKGALGENGLRFWKIFKMYLQNFQSPTTRTYIKLFKTMPKLLHFKVISEMASFVLYQLTHDISRQDISFDRSASDKPKVFTITNLNSVEKVGFSKSINTQVFEIRPHLVKLQAQIKSNSTGARAPTIIAEVAQWCSGYHVLHGLNKG